MIDTCATVRSLPWYEPQPLTHLPLIYHCDHLFPYASYGETATVPMPRDFRMLRVENEFLRVEVAPELGGRVYSLFDKRRGAEMLFSNPVVKPVRILPIWAFISGGIEFNFPIAHSPTSIATVGSAMGQVGGYGFVRVGEREARTGMEWVVELGLLEGVPLLVQRSAFRNQTSRDHPWMSWTICAVRSTAETEFIHPPGRVLIHDSRLAEADWPGNGLNWERNLSEMTAFFWRGEKSGCFGAYHHDLGFGMMHLCRPETLPGKKVWSYGHGAHRAWGQASTIGGLCYAELESGPLLDQGEKALFLSGTERWFEEYWAPVHSREAFADAPWPALDLPPMQDPWLGWGHSDWQLEWEAFREGRQTLPGSAVPVGLDLERPLRIEQEKGNRAAAEALALYLAFHKRPEEALKVLVNPVGPGANRIVGLILWRGLMKPREALPFLEKGPLHDPVAITELDELYAELMLTGERKRRLAAAPAHPLVWERRADLALALDDPAEAVRILSGTSWPREHQRYVRTQLWERAQAGLSQPVTAPPASLGEDRLARFGAYWSDQ